MAYAIIRHRVKDYAHWKRTFDENEPQRRALGRDSIVMVGEEDPNLVVVVTRFESIAAGKQFIFDYMRDRLAASGVAESPHIEYFEDAPEAEP